MVMVNEIMNTWGKPMTAGRMQVQDLVEIRATERIHSENQETFERIAAVYAASGRMASAEVCALLAPALEGRQSWEENEAMLEAMIAELAA